MNLTVGVLPMELFQRNFLSFSKSEIKIEKALQSQVETRARSFPVIKMFSEVSNLLGVSLEIRRSEENNRAYRSRASGDSFILGRHRYAAQIEFKNLQVLHASDCQKVISVISMYFSERLQKTISYSLKTLAKIGDICC
jgi:hypothetical protein